MITAKSTTLMVTARRVTVRIAAIVAMTSATGR